METVLFVDCLLQPFCTTDNFSSDVRWGNTSKEVQIFSVSGFKHQVVRRQELLRAGFNLLEWQDRSQTGHAYSAVE